MPIGMDRRCREERSATATTLIMTATMIVMRIRARVPHH
jgi:hypothetical protein